MKKVTNQFNLSDEKSKNLLSVLKLVEEADSVEEAVWLGEQDREKVAEIRKEIEAQTINN